MANFPTVACKPSVSEWQEGPAFDPTIRNPTEGGYVGTRPRVTRVPEKWHVSLGPLTATERSTLKTFVSSTAKYGAISFNWTHPEDGTKVVRFLPPYITWRRVRPGNLWNAEFDLEEV